MKRAKIAAVKARYNGMSLNPHLKLSVRSSTEYLMVPNKIAENPADINGAIAQLA